MSVSGVPLRYRRCFVRVANGETTRNAWIPIDRAKVGDAIKLQFSDTEWLTYVIVSLDSLVVPAALIAFCEDIPPEREQW